MHAIFRIKWRHLSHGHRGSLIFGGSRYGQLNIKQNAPSYSKPLATQISARKHWSVLVKLISPTIKRDNYWQAQFTRFCNLLLLPPFLRLFSSHLSLWPYLLKTVTQSTIVAAPPHKPTMSHGTLVATPIPKPALTHSTVVALHSPVPALTHTTAVRFFFQPQHSRKKNKSSLENNFSAIVICKVQEFVLNICTRRAEESAINLSGTRTMKPESTSQASLKVLALIKSFGAGRTEGWHFCFSSLNCSFCTLLCAISRRGLSAGGRDYLFRGIGLL